jgi:hypothetical protein
MEKVKKVSFFDILNNLNGGTKSPDMFSEVEACQDNPISSHEIEGAYLPFMINRGLSYFKDTVLYANEMNGIASSLPAKMQYDFYRHALRPRKRFSKWFKKEKDTADVAVIKEHYGYSTEKALEALPLFSREQLDELHALHDKGGRV